MNKLLLFVLGLVVVGGVVAGVYVIGNQTKPAPTPPPVVRPTATPSPSLSVGPGERIAQLKPVANFSGDGTAVRSAIPGRFTVRVQAALPDPPAGKFYQAWLQRPVPSALFPIGQLRAQNGEWDLTLSQTRDATPYTTIFITLETVNDKVPEQKLLQGSF